MSRMRFFATACGTRRFLVHYWQGYGRIFLPRMRLWFELVWGMGGDVLAFGSSLDRVAARLFILRTLEYLADVC